MGETTIKINDGNAFIYIPVVNATGVPISATVKVIVLYLPFAKVNFKVYSPGSNSSAVYKVFWYGASWPTGHNQIFSLQPGGKYAEPGFAGVTVTGKDHQFTSSYVNGELASTNLKSAEVLLPNSVIPALGVIVNATGVPISATVKVIVLYRYNLVGETTIKINDGNAFIYIPVKEAKINTPTDITYILMDGRNGT
mgnify:CR=1 FL=1